MAVLHKLNEARKQFHGAQIKKTGWNDYSKYHYFELGDFLVPALQIFDSLNLSAVVSFGVELASMTLTDLEDGSQFVITSPMSTAQLKACHEVQNLGAVQTYLRRYLWVAALEIVEHDAIDASEGVDASKPRKAFDKSHSPTAITFDNLPSDWKDYLASEAPNVERKFSKEGAAAAEAYVRGLELEPDHHTALFSLLGSKTRTAINAITKGKA